MPEIVDHHSGYRSASARPRVDVRVVEGPAAFAAVTPAWRALHARSDWRTPFLHPTWVARWWAAFGASTPLARRRLALLVAEAGGDVVGILPYYRTTYGIAGPLAFRYVRPIGNDPNITEVRTGLFRPGFEAAVVAAAESYFAETAAEWDFLNWGGFVRPLRPGLSIPGLHFGAERHIPLECFMLNIPSGWDDFAAGLSRNTKEAIRKAHNALKRDQRRVEFMARATPDEIGSELPRFFELHRSRAEATGAVRHPNVFERGRHRSFLADVTAAMAAEGLVRLFVLRVDGAAVAMRLGFVLGDTLYFYYSGFDPAFARYSVMTRLFIEAVRWALDKDIVRFHLSTGRDPAKVRWNPAVLTYQTYSQVGVAARSRALFAILDHT